MSSASGLLSLCALDVGAITYLARRGTTKAAEDKAAELAGKGGRGRGRPSGRGGLSEILGSGEAEEGSRAGQGRRDDPGGGERLPGGGR